MKIAIGLFVSLSLWAQLLPTTEQFAVIDKAAAMMADDNPIAASAVRAKRSEMWLVSGQTSTAMLNTILIEMREYRRHEAAGAKRDELEKLYTKLDSHFRSLLELRDTQARGADRDNLARHAEANRKTPPPKPDQPRVVFFGDSITQGWKIAESFPGQDFLNRGIGGQITGEMLGRMKADVIDLKPRAVILLAGTNDLARGVSVETIENNYSMIADLATANGIKPIFTSVLPVHDYNKDQDPRYQMTRLRPMAAIRELNDWLKKFCAVRGFAYVDYFSAMLDEQGMLKKELANDGLHPNAAGYALMNPLAHDGIASALKSPL